MQLFGFRDQSGVFIRAQGDERSFLHLALRVRGALALRIQQLQRSVAARDQKRVDMVLERQLHALALLQDLMLHREAASVRAQQQASVSFIHKRRAATDREK